MSLRSATHRIPALLALLAFSIFPGYSVEPAHVTSPLPASPSSPVSSTASAGMAVAAAGRSAGSAADEVQAVFQEMLNREMRRFTQRYDDSKKELEEEFVGLQHDREAKSNAITKEIEAVRKVMAGTETILEGEVENFKATMRNLGLSESDQRYIDGLNGLMRQKTVARDSSNRSVSSLRRLYGLNESRFNELMKIHNARETLESGRYREERDLLVRRLANDARLRQTGLTKEESRDIKLRAEGLRDMQREIDRRYFNISGALDEYAALVNARMRQQEKHQKNQNEILLELARAEADDNAPLREKYTKRLEKNNQRLNSAESRYRNDLQYIEEKLALQNSHNHAMARLNQVQREAEQTWNRMNGDFRRQTEELSAQLGTVSTPEAKAELERRLAALKEGVGKDRAAYYAASGNLNERRFLMEQLTNERLQYLKDQNGIARRMSRRPATEADLEQYRAEIGMLEDNRIETEQHVRNRLMALYDAMPADFSDSPWRRGNTEVRQARLTQRLETMRNEIENYFASARAENLITLSEAEGDVSVPGLSPEERAEAERSLAEARAEEDRIEERRARALAALEERGGLEARRLVARAEYMKKRRDLQKSMKSDFFKYEDVVAYNDMLRQLDNDWMSRERVYRERVLPLAALMPLEREWSFRELSDSDGTEDDSALAAHPAPSPSTLVPPFVPQEATPPAGIPEASGTEKALASSPSSSAVLLPGTRDDEDGGVWESVKETLSEAYQETVTFLTGEAKR